MRNKLANYQHSDMLTMYAFYGEYVFGISIACVAIINCNWSRREDNKAAQQMAIYNNNRERWVELGSIYS